MLHIVWQCPVAQSLWQQLRKWWLRLGLFTDTTTATQASFFRAIISLQLPQTPPEVWDLATLHQCTTSPSDIAADPYPVLQAVWQQLVLETIMLIHSWRNADPEQTAQRTTHQAQALHAATCARILRTVATRYASRPTSPTYEAVLVWELLSVFQHDLEPEPVLSLSPMLQTLIFFAGASAAATSTGGARAVIARIDLHTGGVDILWTAATPITIARTTHLHASYAGLLEALTAAVTLGIQAPHVIGDCALILRQLHQHRPPRHPELRRLYHHARRLADGLKVQQWCHHFKPHNQMARSLAARALGPDQPHTTAFPGDGHHQLAYLHMLHADTRPWFATMTPRHGCHI